MFNRTMVTLATEHVSDNVSQAFVIESAIGVFLCHMTNTMCQCSILQAVSYVTPHCGSLLLSYSLQNLLTTS